MKDELYVYVAGPYRLGDPCVNVKNMLDVADELLNLGYFPYAPLLNHFWHFLHPHDEQVWLDLDIAWLKQCDCVLRIPGRSVGADMEEALAVEMGKPVFNFIAELVQYAPLEEEVDE